MHQPLTPPLTPSAPSQVVFSGPFDAFMRLAIRGGLLELITLGFYRFWLTTDIRRHLWGHTSVDGDPAEYTGRAMELLIGFLIAVAILVPLYLGFFLLTMEAERIQAFASIPLVLLIYVLVQFAIYRARRYRLTRTVWRGMRFSMGGSGWSYAALACFWNLITVLTLGIAWPWRSAALERYKMRHASYGTLLGEFAGTGWDLCKQVWYFWALAAGTIALMFFAHDIVSIIAVFALIIAAPFLYGAFKSTEWRWFVSGVRFGEVEFESSLRTSALMSTYWKVIGWMFLFSLIFGMVAGGISIVAMDLIPQTGTPEEQALAIMQHPAVIGAYIVGYLLMAVAIGVVIRIHLMREIWAKIAASTLVYNLAAADNVIGQGTIADALGEGFADSLDIAGGF